ncbi:MAG: AAA-like domain-containing protein [Cyanobacteria bacterium SBLK]|nr:AAA-like domain-containing protein [Cyanobacteria bacterium SBLK]
MSETLKASTRGLATIERAIQRQGWTKTNTPAFWTAAYTSQATLRRFWRKIPIQKATFIAICQAVEIEDWEAIADLDDTEREDLPNDILARVAAFPTHVPDKRLAVLLLTEAVGFSDRMSVNEEQALGLIRRDIQRLALCCQEKEGRVLKFTGDGLLVYFTSAIDAVNCAIAMQKTLAENAANLSPLDILHHRTGIHLGDIYVTEGEVMGNGINIAGDILLEAKPGEICLSQSVYSVVRASLTEEMRDLGKKNLASLSDAISLYYISAIAPQLPVQLPQIADLPAVPEGPVPIASPFYIERSPWERQCYRELKQPGALLRLKAPGQMGKTSLLHRLLHHAARGGTRTARLNLLQVEDAILSSLERFLRWFCTCVTQKLRLSNRVKEYWDEENSSVLNCTYYFETYLLEECEEGLLLGLDEVDRLFQYPKITRGFLPMLRSWYEEAKTLEIWAKFRLVVAHSTEEYGLLDLNQSPFNVGLPIELTEFTAEQVRQLARYHRLEWNETQLQQAIALLGGHPYLIRLAMYHLARNYITFEQLLKEAPTGAGIYEEYLRRHWQIVQANTHLLTTVEKLGRATEAIAIDPLCAYQLDSMGLIHRQGDLVLWRCQLYERFFRNIFNA